MQALPAPLQEARHESRRAALGWLDQLDFVAVEREAREGEARIVPHVLASTRADAEVAAKEGDSVINVADGNRQVIDAQVYEGAGAQPKSGDPRSLRRDHVRDLPELNEYAIGAARRDERRHVAVARIEAIHDAYTV